MRTACTGQAGRQKGQAVAAPVAGFQSRAKVAACGSPAVPRRQQGSRRERRAARWREAGQQARKKAMLALPCRPRQAAGGLRTCRDTSAGLGPSSKKRSSTPASAIQWAAMPPSPPCSLGMPQSAARSTNISAELSLRQAKRANQAEQAKHAAHVCQLKMGARHEPVATPRLACPPHARLSVHAPSGPASAAHKGELYSARAALAAGNHTIKPQHRARATG